jgi:site-specific DNA-methyltransferase (adenine-specific)
MTDINDKLKQLTKKELIIECKKYKISGYSNKTKDQIIKLILSNNNHNNNNLTNNDNNTVNNDDDIKSDTIEYKSNTNYNIKLICGDAYDKLDLVDNNSIQTVCIDPPYNIGKDEWDNIDDYIPWLTKIIVKLQSKMKSNGSMFIFHNDMEQISELMVSIKKNTKLVFKQMIVWNKRFNESKKKGYLDGYVVKEDLHMWNKMCEYILFYTFDNTYKLKNARNDKKIDQITISKEILSRTGGLTGWYSNIETGKNLPTKSTIIPIEKHLGLKYEDIVPKFNNMKTHHSVWNYDMAERNGTHITPKPIDLLINIINHTTDIGDTLLDCFAGSGSLGIACKKTDRNCILIEKDINYCSYIEERIK